MSQSFKRIVLACAVGAGLCAFSATRLFAEDKPTAPAGAAAMSPEDMMKAYAEAGKPVKEHDLLKQIEGKFDAVVKEWHAPGAPPMESKASSENQLLFDGRYVHSKFKGSMMGQPSEGISIMGFDRTKGEYFTFWIDSMSTAAFTSHGTANGNTIEFKSEMTDPVTKLKCAFRMTMEITSKDKHVFIMYMTQAPSTQEVKGMEITYTRAK